MIFILNLQYNFIVFQKNH